jgi:hypothetical protein
VTRSGGAAGGEAKESPVARVGRGEVAKRLGAPTEQQGSVNDPRTTEELGVKWNEKWIYRDPERRGFDRIVLWHRYDLLGLWRIARDGSATPEALPERAGH